MLIGTVVNNGILYVDTVNQNKLSMELEDAMVQAGVTRLRPILMTSLTTILGLLPLAVGYDDAGLCCGSHRRYAGFHCAGFATAANLLSYYG